MTNLTRCKNILEGFQEDFETIKNEFVASSKNLRLEDFFSYWRNARMDCLFANRFDPRELLESIKEMNKKLVAVVTDDTLNLQTRLVALYFLFCVAAKQPNRFRRKIRLTCHDAIELQKLCIEVKQQNSHEDAKFCWQNLRIRDAIDFVEERVAYGPSMLRSRRYQVDEEETSSMEPITAEQKNTGDFIENKLEPAIKDLDSLSAQYRQIKDILRLSEVSGATVDLIDSETSFTGYLDQAKDLLRDYKAAQAHR